MLRALLGVRAFAHLLSPQHHCTEYTDVSGNLLPMLLAVSLSEGSPLLCVLTSDLQRAETLALDLEVLGVPAQQVVVLPSMLGELFEDTPPDLHLVGSRIEALWKVATGRARVLIATPQSLLEPTLPPDALRESTLTLRRGEMVDMEWLLRRLVQLGYEREDLVAQRGQFSRRGGIIDLFPVHADDPVRMEFFGDEIERLQTFDPDSQRASAHLSECTVTPAREVLWEHADVEGAVASLQRMLEETLAQLARGGNPRAPEELRQRIEDDLLRLQNRVTFERLEHYIALLHPGVNALQYLPADCLLVLDEPLQQQTAYAQSARDARDVLSHRARRGEMLPLERLWQAMPLAIPQPEDFPILLSRLLEGRQWVTFSSIPAPRDLLPKAREEELAARALPGYRGQLPALMGTLRNWLESGCVVIVATEQPHRVSEILAEHDLFPTELPPEGEHGALVVAHARLSSGFLWEKARLVVLTDAELFGASRLRILRRHVHEGIPLSSILDLRPGDYVVHIHHGIGIYRGIVQREVLGVRRDYLLIQYAPPDTLLVPTDQIDRLQKYIGSEENPPEVHRLGGSEWALTKRRAKAKARKMAEELIRLYAAREAAERPPYSPDTPWQQEMESAFPYEETPDQRRAILEVKRDMEGSRKPMDRLICGDVGFGKTEVAIRAAFKAVMEGRQVAVLCPTTVLAAQHYNTFRERFAAYPIRVELLSRFRSPREQKEVIEGLRVGAVDVVIGTHRLLSKDVQFYNLGLLVVDEEQRFGVAQKEHIKRLRTQVDVLTLTATPIPRTLHIALGGLRAMSVINDPPFGRLPIRTIVRPYDDDVVREAILRELERGGQVYYVHNRVQSIYHVAQHVQELVPFARIRVAHGQLPEEELEEVMLGFYHHDFDVLVCTTIIENGLDVPNANTLIVERAHRLGLAQLYQLRGRVGRSDRQAYAYFFYHRDAGLDERARQRLNALREFAGLGSGLKLAMRDLEIRGAGNLLGAEQHGAMVSVGFELYAEMLAEAIRELRGQPEETFYLPPVDVPVDVYIPTSYIADESQRILFYKKMTAVRKMADVDEIEAELRDRFGPLPEVVQNALWLLRLRLQAARIGIAEVKADRQWANLRFQGHVRLTPQAVRALTGLHRQHQFTGEGVRLSLAGSASPLAALSDMFDLLESALGQKV
ncbi:MAG: transcription-repair coupling factor [Armatimonadota bacterium]|nr:transcription-repair coupling factor [Armatimonadota bacterium]MDW8104634.1 transcription-repair coupling factor [Armatimonadota bacterium]